MKYIPGDKDKNEIYAQGVIHTRIYFLMHGRVALYDSNGEMRVSLTTGAFREAVWETRTQERVAITENSTLMYIEAAELVRMEGRHPKLAITFHRAVIRDVMRIHKYLIDNPVRQSSFKEFGNIVQVRKVIKSDPDETQDLTGRIKEYIEATDSLRMQIVQAPASRRQRRRSRTNVVVQAAAARSADRLAEKYGIVLSGHELVRYVEYFRLSQQAGLDEKTVYEEGLFPVSDLREAIMDMGYYFSKQEMDSFLMLEKLEGDAMMDHGQFLHAIARASRYEFSENELHLLEKVLKTIAKGDHPLDLLQLRDLFKLVFNLDMNSTDLTVLADTWGGSADKSLTHTAVINMLAYGIKHESLYAMISNAFDFFCGTPGEGENIITPDSLMKAFDNVRIKGDVMNNFTKLQAEEMIWNASIYAHTKLNPRQWKQKLAEKEGQQAAVYAEDYKEENRHNINFVEFVNEISNVYKPGWELSFNNKSATPGLHLHELLTDDIKKEKLELSSRTLSMDDIATIVTPEPSPPPMSRSLLRPTEKSEKSESTDTVDDLNDSSRAVPPVFSRRPISRSRGVSFTMATPGVQERKDTELAEEKRLAEEEKVMRIRVFQDLNFGDAIKDHKMTTCVSLELLAGKWFEMKARNTNLEITILETGQVKFNDSELPELKDSFKVTKGQIKLGKAKVEYTCNRKIERLTWPSTVDTKIWQREKTSKTHSIKMYLPHCPSVQSMLGGGMGIGTTIGVRSNTLESYSVVDAEKEEHKALLDRKLTRAGDKLRSDMNAMYIGRRDRVATMTRRLTEGGTRFDLNVRDVKEELHL